MIKIIDNVLTFEECDFLIEKFAKKMYTMSTLGKQIDSYRIAEGTWIYEDDELSEKIKSFVSKDSGVPVENQEKIHIVKYDIGGEYKPHHDFFHPNTDYYEATMGTSGQRTHSYLFYLNEDFTGGETEFPKKKIKVTPKKGRMLAWRNTNEDGSLDYESYHAGLPVETGIKYIAIIWIRENQFGNTDTKSITIETPIINSKPIIKKIVKPISIDLGKIMEDTNCEFIAEEVMNAVNNNLFNLETDTRYYNNSFGGNIDLGWDVLGRYKSLVEEKIGKEIKFANPYIRVYRNGSTLNLHTDRDGLDWTISLCLFSNIKINWPLIVKDENDKLIEYPTKVGYASLVSGNILEHWREPLQCADDEYVVQIFLHYTQIN